MNFLTIAAEMITALCAIVAVIIAYVTYRNWKSQVLWKVRFDFLREILPILAQCERSLNTFQSHSFGHNEIPVKTIFQPDLCRRIRKRVENMRLKNLRNLIFRIEGYRIDGMLLFDSDFESLVDGLMKDFFSIDSAWTNKQIQLDLICSGVEDLNATTQEEILKYSESMSHDLNQLLTKIGKLKQLLKERAPTK